MRSLSTRIGRVFVEHYKENAAKGKRSDLTLDELLSKIEQWNTKYIVPDGVGTCRLLQS